MGGARGGENTRIGEGQKTRYGRGGTWGEAAHGGVPRDGLIGFARAVRVFFDVMKKAVRDGVWRGAGIAVLALCHCGQVCEGVNLTCRRQFVRNQIVWQDLRLVAQFLAKPAHFGRNYERLRKLRKIMKNVGHEIYAARS